VRGDMVRGEKVRGEKARGERRHSDGGKAETICYFKSLPQSNHQMTTE